MTKDCSFNAFSPHISRSEYEPQRYSPLCRREDWGAETGQMSGWGSWCRVRPPGGCEGGTDAQTGLNHSDLAIMICDWYLCGEHKYSIRDWKRSSIPTFYSVFSSVIPSTFIFLMSITFDRDRAPSTDEEDSSVSFFRGVHLPTITLFPVIPIMWQETMLLIESHRHRHNHFPLQRKQRVGLHEENVQLSAEEVVTVIF